MRLDDRSMAFLEKLENFYHSKIYMHLCQVTADGKRYDQYNHKILRLECSETNSQTFKSS